MTTTDAVCTYRHTSRTLRRHHHRGSGTPQRRADLAALRAQLWDTIARRDRRLARLLIAEDVLLARIGCRKQRHRGHRLLDGRLAAVRATIRAAARRG